MGQPAVRLVEPQPAPSPQAAAYVGHELAEASLALRKALGLLGWRSSDPPLEHQDVPAFKAERISSYVRHAVDSIQGAQDATADQLGADVTELGQRIEHCAETMETLLGLVVDGTGRLPAGSELRRAILLIAASHGYLRADLALLLTALRRG